MEPTPAADPAAAAPAPDLNAQVAQLVSEIKAGAAAAIADAARPAPVAPAAPAQTIEDVRKRIDKIAASEEGGVGAAMLDFGAQVLPGLDAASTRKAINLQRKIAEKDPEVGPLMKKYDKEIKAKIAREKISDEVLAEQGFEDIARSVAAADPAYADAKAEAKAKEMFEKWKAEQAAPSAPAAPASAAPVRPPVEPTAPTRSAAASSVPAKSVEDEIRAIELEPGEEEEARNWGMTPLDVKRQRYEIAQQRKKHGSFGIAAMRGVPICELKDLGISEGGE